MRCKSGRHEWFNQADADKCCNGFLRILVLGGGDNQQECAGVAVGRAWMAIAAAEAMQPRVRKGKASTERSRSVTPKYEVVK